MLFYAIVMYLESSPSFIIFFFSSFTNLKVSGVQTILDFIGFHCIEQHESE